MQLPNELLESFQPFTVKDSYLISFEGIEGSGKTTQIDKLKQYLQSKNKTVYCFREPGGTKFGERLRSAILESDAPIHPIAEAYLFAAARAQLLNQEIIPKLKIPNTVVILDRYIDSSIAYQGSARGLGINQILQLHQPAPLNIAAHLTIYLHIDLTTSMERQHKRGNEKDYFEKETHAFYQKLIEGYDLAAKTFPKRITTIEAKLDIENIHRQIIETLNQKLGI
jgi:dTMP kinase